MLRTPKVGELLLDYIKTNMTNNSGKKISCFKAAKQIFMAFGNQALEGNWADMANEWSDIDTHTATEEEQLKTTKLVRVISDKVQSYLDMLSNKRTWIFK